MKLGAFYREHLLVQILAVLTIVLILTMGSMVIFNIRSQSLIIKDLLNKQHEVLFSSVERAINIDDALSEGDNDRVREKIRRFGQEMPDLDLFIYDFKQKISFAVIPQIEGRTLSAIIKNSKAIDAVNRMMESGKAPAEPFNDQEKGKQYISLFRPILNAPSCFKCHGNSRKVLGGIVVRASFEKVSDIIRTARNKNIIMGILGLGIIIVLICLLFQRFVNRPIQMLLESTGKLKRGDFTHIAMVKSQDEIGHICARMNIVSGSLRDMIEEVLTAAQTLASSSTDLSTIARQVSSGAKQTSDMADSVTASAEGMNFNMNSVASAMEQTHTQVGIVASSAEEMTATINEIAQNSENARKISGEAVAQTEGASVKVDELGKAVSKIGKITETITKISEQTNLLALNATIEAARAGEAGKGFAVVANEVKNLAKQTAESTEDIKQQIESIQGSTEDTVVQIEQISRVINDVNEIVTSIALAVEDQSVTTKEIAINMAQASEGISEVNENVLQSTTVAGEIAKDITEVNHAAKDMSNSSIHVQMSSEELSMLTDQLMDAVGKFKV